MSGDPRAILARMQSRTDAAAAAVDAATSPAAIDVAVGMSQADTPRLIAAVQAVLDLCDEGRVSADAIRRAVAGALSP